MYLVFITGYYTISWYYIQVIQFCNFFKICTHPLPEGSSCALKGF